MLERVQRVVPTFLALRRQGDPQALLLLLRACAGVYRLVYFLRCIPPAGTQRAAREFDSLLL